MATMYIASTDTASGKTALCLGLGKRLQSDGFSVGYMKPISLSAHRLEGSMVDEDARFIKKELQLAEPISDLVPIPLDPQAVESIMRKQKWLDYPKRLLEVFSRVSKGKDVMLVEGVDRLSAGGLIRLPANEVCKLLGAKSLTVVRYTGLLSLDAVLFYRRVLGDPMIGAVMNGVPPRLMESAEAVAKPYLQKEGILVYGVLPEDRFLMSVSVKELAEALEAEIVTRPDKGEELVQNLMVGAMTADVALSYFRQKPNKAVITGGDRSDIQLAALQTSTNCLILTGNLHPQDMIKGVAQEMGVPIVVSKYDTLTTIEIVEGFFGKSRFQQEKKTQRFQELLSEHFDFTSLYVTMGLK
ncbi:MAG: phosphotransacetylase family protein [Anaerolineae bacterium]|nr:phosphotransacetylase family protein [Anaerolineae bacterium]